MGAARNKVFLELAGRPVLAHALQAFDAHPGVCELVVVLAAGEDAVFEREVASRLGLDKPLRLAVGGATRQASALSGLHAARAEAPLVLVHDGARPFVPRALIDRMLAAAAAHGAAVPGVPVRDSLKRADAGGSVVDSPDRDDLYLAQTPQGFERALLLRSLERAEAAGDVFSDDASAVARYGRVPARLVPGDPTNLKVTTPFDLHLAACLLQARRG